MKVAIVTFSYTAIDEDEYGYRECKRREKGIIIPTEPLLHPEILYVQSFSLEALLFTLQDELLDGTLRYVTVDPFLRTDSSSSCRCPKNRRDIELRGETELDDDVVQCIRRFVDLAPLFKEGRNSLWELLKKVQ